MHSNPIILFYIYIWFTFCSTMEGNEKERIVSQFSHSESSVADRIFGGKIADSYYSFFAFLSIFNGAGTFSCGGSLISNRWILTAAHCVNWQSVSITIELGAVNRIVEVKYCIFHEAYNKTTHENDVALVKLLYDLKFTTYINAVQLATNFENYDGVKAVAIGRGMTETGNESPYLLYVDVTIITNKECSKTDEVHGKLIKSMHLCTSGEGIVGTCSGDSGGPLLVNGIQVGISAFGANNCAEGKPSVYMRVEKYHRWILNKIKEVDGVDKTDTNNFRLILAVVVILAICLLIFYCINLMKPF